MVYIGTIGADSVAPRRYQSGGRRTFGSIRNAGTAWCEPLDEGRHVMLTRYKGQLSSRTGPCYRQAINEAQSVSCSWLAASVSMMYGNAREGPSSNGGSPRNRQDRRRIAAPRGVTPREGADDGADA